MKINAKNGSIIFIKCNGNDFPMNNLVPTIIPGICLKIKRIINNY